jgi:hypothetical protein
MIQSDLEPCCICLEEYTCTFDKKHLCTLRCEHSAHDVCMMRWMASNPTCPCCRTVYTTCNHGTLADHRKEVILDVLRVTKDDLQKAKIEIQLYQDHLIAIDLQRAEEMMIRPNVQTVPLFAMLQLAREHNHDSGDED